MWTCLKVAILIYWKAVISMCMYSMFCGYEVNGQILFLATK